MARSATTGRHRGASPKSAARGSKATLVLAVLLLVAGLGVFVYPAAASSITRVEYAAAATRYTTSVAQLPLAQRNAELSRAHAYNDGLRETLLTDAFSDLNAANLVDGDPYWDTLAVDGDGVMGRLTIPTIALDLPIYHGTSEAALSRGVGHLRGTALPVGGEGTHAVLSGHNGVPGSELFSRLDEMQIGDRFTISSFGAELTYAVIDITSVVPTDTKSLHPREGRDLVTLVTCTPTGVNSHRLLVTAERVTTPPPSTATLVADQRAPIGGPEPAVVSERSATNWALPLVLIGLGIVVAAGLAALVVAVIARRAPRPRRVTYISGSPYRGD